jgi:hypothetical protein
VTALHVGERPAEGAHLELLHLDDPVGRHLVRREVGDEVAELVHRDHLAHDGLPLVDRLGIREPHGDRDERLAKAFQAEAHREGCGGRREDIAAVEGGGGVGRLGNRDGHRVEQVNTSEGPVIRPDRPVPAGAEGEGGAPGADARIHDDEVHGAGGVAVPRASQQIRGGAGVAGRDRVAQVREGDPGRPGVEDAAHFRDVGVRGAEIGEQGDEGHGEAKVWKLGGLEVRKLPNFPTS